NPSSAQVITDFQTGTNIADHYGQRLRAFVVPPVSGAYTFWISSDDSSELLLSSDENSNNVSRIAWVNVWTDPHVWNKETNQQSLPIALEGGRRYYLERRMQDGSGGDNFSVRWRLPDGTIEEPLTATTTPGTRHIPCRTPS